MQAESAIEFTVPGAPVGKERPRMAAGRMYTPAKTASYESLVAYAAAAAMKGRPLLEGACSCSLDIVLPIPASWSRKKQAQALEGSLHPTTKPDKDNVIKAFYDAMNGVVWRDDVQACIGLQVKRYGPVPGVRVRVEMIEMIREAVD
ncbi:MAG: RusA family crossover junction endodeoxyribonuclease [Betaproteobacteria bacterium]|nr:RusA family crossover junction endodeoxyribonuclease [Betaproteobacteria bacterium]